MIGVALGFISGRFHSTPWGRHVNEGTPEWPPSPWRLLRALVATWKRKLDDHVALDEVAGILALLAEPPMFVLPHAATGHTRHYMPWFKKGPDDRTLVFDAFVAVPKGSEVVALWPSTQLSDARRTALAEILVHLSFLGRSESWCTARLLSNAEALETSDWVNCRPINGAPVARDQELVGVLCADPDTAFCNNAFVRTIQRKRGKQVVQVEEKSVAYDPDWHLCAETLWLHSEGWSDPPGSRWIQYARPRSCFRVEPRRSRTRPHVRQRVCQVARFALDSTVLPLVTETLPIAESARRCVMGIFGRQNPRSDGTKGASAVFSGKTLDATPLEGHCHAYYLPTDEDGDGRLDHLTIVARNGFDPQEMLALDELTELHVRSRDDSAHPLRVLWLGWGEIGNYGVGPLRNSCQWISATPFIAPRYPKRRGTKRDPEGALRRPAQFLELTLREEISRLLARDARYRDVDPNQIVIEPLGDEQGIFRIRRSKDDPHGLRPIQFKRFRQKRGDDGGRRLAGAFRILFPVPVPGPICLGHSSHFGMGLFLPGQ